MTFNRSTAALAGLLSVGMLLTACGAAARGDSPSPTEPPSATSGVPSVTVERSQAIVPTGSPADEPPTPEPPMAEPPAGSLAVEGGDPVVGQLGSFTWENGGADSPWRPGSPIHVGRGEQVVLTLAEPVPLTSWTISRTPASTFGEDIVGMAEGSTETPRFEAPPAGSWSVSISVWFADNRGDATYYWLIDVD
jgi:hypothetical protein